MRYFLKLSYNGAGFHGWQRQPNAYSVQEAIEKVLSLLLKENISITGAGRTDTGVHAREMFAHFDVVSQINDKKQFLKSVNSLVGKNIVIHDLINVKDDAHARFDVIQRTYKYFIIKEKSPFFFPFAWTYEASLDTEMMNHAAKILLETEDFTSFAKLHSDAKTIICKVTHANWETYDNSNSDFPFFRVPQLVFTITADRFLRNMVRAVVGTLLDVGRHKISINDFKDIILKKDRCEAGISVPAQGLFLWQVKYPYL